MDRLFSTNAPDSFWLLDQYDHAQAWDDGVFDATQSTGSVEQLHLYEPFPYCHGGTFVRSADTPERLNVYIQEQSQSAWNSNSRPVGTLHYGADQPPLAQAMSNQNAMALSHLPWDPDQTANEAQADLTLEELFPNPLDHFSDTAKKALIARFASNIYRKILAAQLLPAAISAQGQLLPTVEDHPDGDLSTGYQYIIDQVGDEVATMLARSHVIPRVAKACTDLLPTASHACVILPEELIRLYVTTRPALQALRNGTSDRKFVVTQPLRRSKQQFLKGLAKLEGLRYIMLDQGQKRRLLVFKDNISDASDLYFGPECDKNNLPWFFDPMTAMTMLLTPVSRRRAAIAVDKLSGGSHIAWSCSSIQPILHESSAYFGSSGNAAFVLEPFWTGEELDPTIMDRRNRYRSLRSHAKAEVLAGKPAGTVFGGRHAHNQLPLAEEDYTALNDLMHQMAIIDDYDDVAFTARKSSPASERAQQTRVRIPSNNAQVSTNQHHLAAQQTDRELGLRRMNAVNTIETPQYHVSSKRSLGAFQVDLPPGSESVVGEYTRSVDVQSREDRWQSHHPRSKKRRVRPEDRRRHERVEQGYWCQYPGCTKMFNRNSDRTRHEKVHIPEHQRKYGCGTCEKRFHDHKDLTRHIRGHEWRSRLAVPQPWGDV